MKILPLLALALCLGLSACNDVAIALSCPPSQLPSVVVSVLDPLSGSSVAAEARGWWTVNGSTDSLRHMSGESFSQLAAFGPAGMYTLRVERAGYADWEQSNVIVTQDECGPATVHVTATPQALQQ